MTVISVRWFALLLVVSCLLGSGQVKAQILPPNNLGLEDNLFQIQDVSEKEFNETIEEVVKFYSPVVAGHGATLKVVKEWENPEVNAYATQSGSDWIIGFFGGLARRKEVTRDAFTLVVCHELGHHLAGFPFKGERWAATEGQSDYFATQECAKELWTNNDEKNADAALTVDIFAKEQCDRSNDSRRARELCYRISNASYQLALLLSGAAGKNANAAKPEFGTPDSAVVERTYIGHPAAQCRLDTMFQGSICKASFNNNLIPGKDVKEGRGSLEAEIEAAGQSCMNRSGYSEGLRPLCWFKPRI